MLKRLSSNQRYTIPQACLPRHSTMRTRAGYLKLHRPGDVKLPGLFIMTKRQKYNRSFRGKLNNTYYEMYRRVAGRLKKHYMYAGLPIVDKDSFIEWASEDFEYQQLWEKWRDSGFKYRFMPSIDRIDTSEGYILGNMKWAVFHKNVRVNKNFKQFGQLQKEIITTGPYS